jgi:hypothetical protein
VPPRLGDDLVPLVGQVCDSDACHAA